MQRSRESSSVVPDGTALALGLRDQRLAKPNGAFCNAFLVVTGILAQIQSWAVMRNNLKWRKDVFWLTDLMFQCSSCWLHCFGIEVR